MYNREQSRITGKHLKIHGYYHQISDKCDGTKQDKTQLITILNKVDDNEAYM